MIATRNVVITGVGVVSPIGIGRGPYWEALRAGRSGVRLTQRYGTAPLPSPLGAELRDFDAKQYVTPRKSLKVMCAEIQAGFAAAALAIEDARLAAGSIAPERMGVVFGGEMLYGDPLELAPLYNACTVDGKFNYGKFGTAFPSQLFPLWMLKYLPNMTACHIGISVDARGPNNTIVSGEASSLLALGEAIAVLRRGGADVMIAGATSSRLNLTGIMYRGDCLLSQRTDSPESASRPFDLHRDGMVNGEGAGGVVLETAEHAHARGATVLAEVLGTASTFGPPDPTGAGRQQAIARSIGQLLTNCHLTPHDIDHVNAHGLSTVDDDRIEARAIAEQLGTTPVTALKSYFGNLGAAGGMVELIASVIGLQEGIVPGTLNYSTPDPNCPIEVIHGEPRLVRRPVALSLNQSRTGQSAAVAIRRPG